MRVLASFLGSPFRTDPYDSLNFFRNGNPSWWFSTFLLKYAFKNPYISFPSDPPYSDAGSNSHDGGFLSHFILSIIRHR